MSLALNLSSVCRIIQFICLYVPGKYVRLEIENGSMQEYVYTRISEASHMTIPSSLLMGQDGPTTYNESEAGVQRDSLQ